MYIEQLLTPHLSASAYYIESGKEAAVIDPMRDVQQYMDLAKKRGTVIRYVFATHIHSDYVSGCCELAEKTGAALVFGSEVVAGFPLHAAIDGEEFRIGFLTLRVLHTPGHTIESTCYLLLDDRNNPHSVFTGDTLFIDDVGRPDLFPNTNAEAEQCAATLYDSIQQKLLSLPGYVIVYPGHGSGSACGKVIGKDRYSTLGIQRKTNYALKVVNRQEFIRLVTDSPDEPPKYFSYVTKLNHEKTEDLEKVLNRNIKPLEIAQFKSFASLADTVIIDTRRKEVFSAVHIPGSVFLGMDGNFEYAAGLVLDPQKKLLVVCDPGTEKEVFKSLARTGFDNAHGYLSGGINAWITAGETVSALENISSENVASRFHYPSDIIIDVRDPNEWIPGIVAGAKLIPLRQISESSSGLDPKKNIFVYCSVGYRSMIAASILKKGGFGKVINVIGGMQQMKQTPIPVRQLSRIG